MQLKPASWMVEFAAASIMKDLSWLKNNDAIDILIFALSVTLAQPSDSWSCSKNRERDRRDLLKRIKHLNYKIYITPSDGFAVKFK